MPNALLRKASRIADKWMRHGALIIFKEGVSNICTMIVRDPRSGALHILHQAIEIVARVRDADDADCGAIPKLRAIKFRDGDVESRPQPVFQTAHDLPPIFDGLRSFDVKFEGEKSNRHSVSGFRFRVSGEVPFDSHPRILEP